MLSRLVASATRKGGERGGRGGAVGRAATRAFRRGQVDQASWRARRGCRRTRSAGRCEARRRRAISGRRGRAKLDPFKDEIHRLLARGSRSCPGCGSGSCSSRWGARRARRSSMTICARCGRCSRRPARTFQRTVYRPGRSASSMCGSRASRGPGRARPDPPGVGRGRVLGLLARGRGRAGVLTSRPRICWPGSRAACRRLGALPKELVWDRQAGIHGHGGRPDGRVRRRSAASCGSAWRFCEPADPQAKGAVERLQGYAETNFEPGRRFANELDFQAQLDAWFLKVNARHAQDAARPAGRSAGRGAAR